MKSSQFLASVSGLVLQAADALGVRSPRHDALLGLLSDGVVESNIEGRITYMNPAACRMLQRTLESGEAPYIWDFIEGLDERIAARRLFADYIVRQPVSEPYETRLVRGDGTAFDVRSTWSYCKDERGRLTGLVSVFQDVSVQREAQREAEAREHLSRAVFDSMFQYTFVLSPEGVLLDANRAAGAFMRMVVEQATGRLLCELPPWNGAGPGCDSLRQRIANARQGAFQRFECDFSEMRQGLNIDFSLKPVNDREGQVLLLLLEGRDISERVHVQAAAHAEREQFRNIIESGQSGFAIFDIDGNVQYLNSYARRIIGDYVDVVEARSVLSPDWSVSAIEGGPRSSGADSFVRIVGMGEVLTEREVALTLPGGRRLLLRISGTPLRERDGTVSAVVFSFEDITDRHLISDALQASEARLRAIYNSAFDGLISIDANGRIFEMNPAAEKIFDYGIAELRGRNISSLMPSPFADRHDDYLAAYLAGGGPNVIGKVRELTGLRKGGISFPMELTVTEGSYGGARIFTGVVRDLSEKKRAEELQLRLLSIVEASPDLIGMTNEDGDIVHLNRAGRRFFGTNPSEQLPMESLAVHAPWVRKKLLKEAIPSAIRHGVWTGQTALVSPERGEVPMLESLLAHDVTTGGRRNYYSVICRDISGMKRVENLKDGLISTVSHELRTPLTSIHGSLALLAAGMAGSIDDEAREVLQVALKGTSRLENLIHNFLYLDAIESGRVDMGCQSMDVAGALDEVVQSLEPGERAVSVVFEKPGQPVLSLAHPEHLRQVLANLLSNAVKFSAPESEVGVALFHESQGVRIEIADRGPGITRTFANQVFHRFARADSSDHRETEGTGLGLSIAWALVTGMGGDIGFRAREGGGTVFWLQLKR